MGAIVVVAPACPPWFQIVVAFVGAIVVAISAATLGICATRKPSASDILAPTN